MAEKLCQIKKKGGKKESGFDETTLWTNNAPTSAFAAQTITLSDSIDNYDYIKISAVYSTASNTLATAMMSVADFKNCTDYATGKGIPQFAVCLNDGSGTPIARIRRCSYLSSTQVKIDAGRMA